ncbi:MAG: DUF4390 domain-containing protein [Gammaproteobacteria bacterium]|nr:DUF4390 domain-containing protein [Gammaproteobacteria bacterium]
MSTVGRILVSLLWLWGGWATAADFQFREVQIERHGKQYILNMQIEYRLSESALEALRNGVPLLLEVRVQVEKVWGSFWEPRPMEQSLRHQIRYHALTGLYRVVDMQSGDEENFVTREAALHALGELQRLQLISSDALAPGEEYHVRIRADLDIESLPLPLRPLAYLNKDWRLTSGWSQWPLKP